MLQARLFFLVKLIALIFIVSSSIMVQLIKKGGLRERANRSHRYQDSENRITTLNPNRYQQKLSTQIEQSDSIKPQPNCENQEQQSRD